MSHYLLKLSFGPVQGFIASARRSRDLWAGSHLLSEAVRTAARRLQDGGARLIYPTPAAVANTQGSNLSNVMMASVAMGDAAAVAELARAAQTSARDRIAGIAQSELEKWRKCTPGLRADLWSAQIDGVLDTYAAWATWSGDDKDYRAAYARLKEAFAQRKSTRDFRPAPLLSAKYAGLPKSSLDGANESVLPDSKGQTARSWNQRMGVAKGEQLDAIGCVKRSFGRQESFTALPRIAADPWLRQLNPELRDRLCAAYEPLVNLGLATRCSGNDGIYKAFPYDAGLLFGSALDTALQEARADLDHEAVSMLEALNQTLRSAGSKPNPYVALMCADGDRMGVFVDSAQTPQDHAAISAAIVAFADQVPGIAREHRGHAIFNGGEDLMVAFPLQSVVEGALALSRAFEAAVGDLADRLLDRATLDQQGRPSLRAGVAICHVSEPMGYIRECADRAEKIAKGGKGEVGGTQQGNALALVLNGRGGHVVPVRLSFSEQGKTDFTALNDWCEYYKANELPSRVAYDCREIARLDVKLKHGTPPTETCDKRITILQVEFQRILDRARIQGGSSALSTRVRDALLQRAT